MAWMDDWLGSMNLTSSFSGLGKGDDHKIKPSKSKEKTKQDLFDAYRRGTGGGGYIPVTTPPTTPSNIGGNTPAHATRDEIYGFIEEYHGDDISLLHQHALDLGKAHRDAKAHRDEISETLHEKHLAHGHNYAGIDHTHSNGGGGEKCEWWDLQCQFSKGMEGLGKLALIGVIAFFAFMLIKKRLKI
jgi:hypothetical protein